MDRERRSSSVTVLSERGSNKAGMARRRKFMIVGVVVVLAAVGAAVGIVVSKKSSSDSSTSSGNSSSGTSGTSGGSSGTTSSGGTSKWETSNSSGSSSNGTTVSKITSDPTTATLSLAAFAIGDWGSTVGKDSCCGDSSTYTEFDVIAEDVVATLMDLQAGAATVKPKVIIGHGDNFYWAGIQGDSDQSYRFTKTFENKFTGSNLADIPWVNVLGNHDYGGSSFICTKDGELAECASTDDMLAALEKKFTWQSKYTSPNGDRWKLEDHFYTHSISDSASGVSIDIFNIDANDADTHGALQICCQCYGYAEGDDSQCNNVAPGQKYCAGGSMDMYNKCMAKISSWADDSRTQLAEKVKASTATWKIVNSHYSPYVHYAETGMKKWFDILDGSGVQLWMNGHTHGEKHDFSSPLAVHFVENGAGGGIQKESASGIPAVASAYVKNKWTYGGNEYGFFSVTAGKEWLKLQYHTADSKWTFAETIGAAKAGGVATKHCWYIPVDGSEGQDCTSS
ncbi:Tartrate-resistant acid phosphatase type 5, partial [Globisporangium splendens]